MGHKDWNTEDSENTGTVKIHEPSEEELKAIKQKVNAHIDDLCKVLSQSTQWNQTRFDASQRALINDILINLTLGHNIILEASTGVGKSIIALFIATYMRSYILTSDKMLQQQYEDFINNVLLKYSATHPNQAFRKITVLRGQSNYQCHINKLAFNEGVCQESGMSIKQALNEMPCAQKCGYIAARQKAIDSWSCVMNYAYWLTYMNQTGHEAFGERKVTIMDECHKIDEIVSSYMDLVIGPKFIQTCMKAESLIAGMCTVSEQTKYVKCRDELFDALKAIIKIASTNADITELREAIRTLTHRAVGLLESVSTPHETVTKKRQNGGQLNMFDKAFLRFASTCRDLAGQLATILDATEAEPHTLIVVLNAEDNSVAFRCTNDALLAKHCIHRHCSQQVFMSATIGDIDAWAKLNAIENYKAYSVHAEWCFEHSPINICTPLLSLSYANINQNLPELVKRIDAIMAKHPQENGVIHCATRKIARFILENSLCRGRLVSYDNTSEKNEVVQKVLVPGNNKVLVAFSATEGISLDDDKCRFQIIAKLSWQNLGDIVIKTKSDNNPEWYTLKTLQALIQAIGRGIRNADDWCVAYVLDSSFERINRACKFTDAFKQRFKWLNDAKQLKQATQASIDALNAAFEDDDFFKNF